MNVLERAQRRAFSMRLDCNYLLHTPPLINERTLLVVALHGYGSNAADMLRLAVTWFAGHVVASIQAPSQFFLPGRPKPPKREVGYCWATPEHPETSVRLHHEMLLHVLNEAGREYGIPAQRSIVLGFSQPVSLNYRFAATFPDAVRGVIGLCGGIPRNWRDGPYQPVSAAVLHIARKEDEFYPVEVTQAYEESLRERAGDVEFHLLDGGHRFPSLGRPIVDRWVARVSGTTYPD